MRKWMMSSLAVATLAALGSQGAWAEGPATEGGAHPSWAAHQSGGYRTLNIPVGTQQTLSFTEPAYRVAVGNPKTASVAPLPRSGGRQFLITGLSTGTTSLLVWNLGHKTPKVWQLQVSVPVPAAPLAAPAPGMPTVRAQGDAVTLSGAVADQVKHEAALEAAALAAGKTGKVIDQSVIPVDDEVQVGVKVVEFSKAQLKNVGINIFSSTGGFSLGTFGPSTLTSANYPVSLASGGPGALALTGVAPFTQAFNLVGGVGNSGLSSYLSLLEGNNILRVLAEPTLVAMNGQQASFLAGGEIPIPVPQSSGVGTPTITIQYKKYGVQLDLTPTILSAHRIALHVAPSVSSLDYTNAITLNGYSVPALLVRQADTTVTLGNGESLVIGGLVDRQMQQNISKVPILGDLPILGAFFRSIQYSKQDMELAIIVTPRLVRPIAAGAKLPPLPGAAFAHSHFNLGKAVLLPGSEYDQPDNGPGYSQ
ncbi:pilus assembly protein N-terminal domain-containing protein [Acidithiobacillus sp.]|uniref:type II and III secretion system protein family protein n=1 Tax=Acidithiobacillus sp. TaxID=1872118 RepID=UPI0025833E08|nr:pilus assembly protein N-terminal domain-containing protein [Acidithiobacillus sp.]MDD5374038.1 pilus assembly protein N-terminal domain-containing protein [Acidithiobacillus sp.]